MCPDQDLKGVARHTCSNLGNYILLTLVLFHVTGRWQISPHFLKKEPNNYRPISLTSIVSKLFEHILSSNIRRHLETNSILHHHQHGFRQFHSCKTQLISLVQDLTLNFDEDIQTDLISMDFAKGLRPLILWLTTDYYTDNLQWYGIQGKVHQWISNFLTNRH